MPNQPNGCPARWTLLSEVVMHPTYTISEGVVKSLTAELPEHEDDDRHGHDAHDNPLQRPAVSCVLQVASEIHSRPPSELDVREQPGIVLADVIQDDDEQDDSTQVLPLPGSYRLRSHHFTCFPLHEQLQSRFFTVW